MDYRYVVIVSLLVTPACDGGSTPDEGADPTASTGSETTGDESASTGSSTGGDEPGGTEDPGAVTEGCNDGGAPSYFVLDLGEATIPPGIYTITLGDEWGTPVQSCELSMPEGTGCSFDSESHTVTLPAGTRLLTAPIQLTVTSGDVTLHDETSLFENSVSSDGCWSSGTGWGAIELGALQCASLEELFVAEVEAVRGCTEAAECGTVIAGFSCGCTRDWVGRLDADPSDLIELAENASAGACDWAAWSSDCDCPETDGYACIDDTCTWNYVEG